MFCNHRWDVDVSVDCLSEHVEIVFLALRRTITEIGENAFMWQGRSVTNHIIEIVSLNLSCVHVFINFSLFSHVVFFKIIFLNLLPF